MMVFVVLAVIVVVGIIVVVVVVVVAVAWGKIYGGVIVSMIPARLSMERK